MSVFCHLGLNDIYYDTLYIKACKHNFPSEICWIVINAGHDWSGWQLWAVPELFDSIISLNQVFTSFHSPRAGNQKPALYWWQDQLVSKHDCSCPLDQFFVKFLKKHITLIANCNEVSFMPPSREFPLISECIAKWHLSMWKFFALRCPLFCSFMLFL